MKIKSYIIATVCFCLGAHTLAAQREFAQWIAKCQRQLDSSQFQLALETAQAAQAQCGPGRQEERFAACCMAGLACAKIAPDTAIAIYGALQSMPQPKGMAVQALAAYFAAQCYHLYADIPVYRDTALLFYEQAIALYRQLPGKPHANIGNAYVNQGVIYSDYLSHHLEGLDLINKGGVILSQRYGTTHPAYARVLHNRSLLFWRQGNYLHAEEQARAAKSIRAKKLTPTHREVLAGYLQYGLSLEGLGRIDEALDCFELILERAQTIAFPDAYTKRVVSYAHTDVGLVYSRMGETEASKKKFQAVWRQEKAAKSTSEWPTTLFNIATQWEEEARFDSASHYYAQALEIAPEDHPERAYFLNGMGLAEAGSGNWGSAERYFLKAYECWMAHGKGQAQLAVTACYNMARVNLYEGKYREALDWNEKGQQLIGYSNGVLLENVPALHDLCLLLTQASQIQLTQPGEGSLTEALESCKLALAALRGTIQQFRDDQVREIVAYSKASEIFETSIALQRRLYEKTSNKTHWEHAFHIAEQSKALELLRKIKASDPTLYGCFPTDLLSKEMSLKKRLISVVAQLETSEEPTSSMSAQGGGAERRLALRDSLYDVQAHMQTNYPDCWQQRANTEVVDIGTFRKNTLESDQVLLEYFIGKDSIYLFVLRPDDIFMEAIPREESLEKNVEMLLEGIGQPKGKPGGGKQMTEASVQLYKWLIAPVEPWLKRCERLLIVPDGVLGRIPFQLLLSKKPVKEGVWFYYKDLYLIRHFAVSTQYSATNLHYIKQRRTAFKPLTNLLAVAPFTNPRAQWGGSIPNAGTLYDCIEHSKTETDSAIAIWKGQLMQPPYISRFWRVASNCNILHLATHGYADPQNGDRSWLAFQDPKHPHQYVKLRTAEFYSQRLNAELAIFSSCESGAGPVRRREGVIAFSRAALAAGARSTAVTLWKVTDSPNSIEIMINFHRYLKQGMAKDVALQKAQLAYLDHYTGYDDKLPHPYYWSAWLLNGDMRPIP